MLNRNLIDKLQDMLEFFRKENVQIHAGLDIDFESHESKKQEYEKIMKELGEYIKTDHGKANLEKFTGTQELYNIMGDLKKNMQENQARLSVRLQFCNIIARAVDVCMRESGWNYSGDGNFSSYGNRVVLDYNV